MSVIRRKFMTFLTKPDKTVAKYFRIVILRQILPIYREDYTAHWGFTSFKDKVVLDFGADYGSTAYYFLKRKAKAVIAVEGDKTLYMKLLRHYGKKKNVHCICKMINSPSDFALLLSRYIADIVKVDIEGAEKHLANTPSILILKFKEWLIETHCDGVATELKQRFSMLGFAVSLYVYSDGVTANKILYAKRSELK